MAVAASGRFKEPEQDLAIGPKFAHRFGTHALCGRLVAGNRVRF
jgi:hypothetical protein